MAEGEGFLERCALCAASTSHDALQGGTDPGGLFQDLSLQLRAGRDPEDHLPLAIKVSWGWRREANTERSQRKGKVFLMSINNAQLAALMTVQPERETEVGMGQGRA